MLRDAVGGRELAQGAVRVASELCNRPVTGAVLRRHVDVVAFWAVRDRGRTGQPIGRLVPSERVPVLPCSAMQPIRVREPSALRANSTLESSSVPIA